MDSFIEDLLLSARSTIKRYSNPQLLLITGFPRSGTTYMYRFLNELGIKVGHEESSFQGTVSWLHASLLEEIKFKNIFHQTRNPIKVINSFQNLAVSIFLEYMEKYIFIPKRKSNLIQSAYAWVGWNELLEKISDWRYQIEDIDLIFGQLCERLGICKTTLPDIPRNINTGNQKHFFSWKDIKKQDEEIAEKILEKGIQYGYSEKEIIKGDNNEFN